MKLAQARCARLLVVALSAVVLLGGCGGTEEPASETKSRADSGAKPAENQDDQPILTPESLAAVWKSYDQRNNAAMPKAGPPTYDGRAYSEADTGPLLQKDLTSAAFGRKTSRKASRPFTTTPRDLYAPTVAAGFALSSVTESFNRRGQALMALVQQDDVWKKEMSVVLTKGATLPDPLAPGKDSTATEADVARVRKAATAVGSFWSTLRQPRAVDLGSARDVYFVKTFRAVRESSDRATGGVDVGEPCRGGQPGTDAVRVVRARGGLVALVCLQVRDHFKATQPGVTLADTGDVAELFGKQSRTSVQHRWEMTLALSVPDSGKAVVLGTTSVPVVAPSKS